MSTVEPRIAYYKLAPDGIKHLHALERYLADCGLEKSLIEAVKLRTSQINGCAYCLDMHSKDALAAGETPQRLVALAAWQETPFFTDRERAALVWLFSTHMLVLMPGSGTKNEPQMNADRRRFSSGLRSQYWAMITNLVVTLPLAPWL